MFVVDSYYLEKMILFWITLLVALIGSNAEGEFCVLHTPDSLSFIRTIDTWESHLKEIYSAALGLSVEYHAEWKGLYIMDPFATPEAAVEVHVDGLPSLSKYAGWKAKIFPLIVDELEPNTFKGVESRIKQHFNDGRNKVVNVKLSSETRLIAIRRAFGTTNVTGNKPKPILKLKHLNQAVEEDRYFLRELMTLQTIIGKVRSGAIVPDHLIDFYHFRFRAIHLLSDFYGPISAQTKEAKKLLGGVLLELNKAFVKAYDGSILVTVVTTDVAHTRRSARSVTKPPGHSKKWPYEWLEPPLDWKKYPLKPTPPNRRQAVNENEEGPKEEKAELDPIETLENEKDAEQGTNEEKKGGSIEIYEDMADDEFVERSNEDLILMRSEDNNNETYKHQKAEDTYAMFNILLWFGVAISFSILAIVYACMDMDPGRDTIIYRLTTMRTKKEL